MAAYRFCRTDDIALLVDAVNRCWGPCFAAEPEMTVIRFKREIRDLQVWCSSCMVAFAGADPIGVMIGAKRAGGTLVQRIAVHPDHRRQGHARHLLTSLGSKLAILGPPRIVAELPGHAGPAHDLFLACGFSPDVSYSDLVLDLDSPAARTGPGGPAAQRIDTLPGRLVIPVTLDDLAANGLGSETDPRTCWERCADTLAARKDEIAGLAIATDERLEAYLLYAPSFDAAGNADGAQILALRSEIEDEGASRERILLERLIAQAGGPLRMNKVHPQEVPARVLADLGFRVDGDHTRYTGAARAA